MASDDPDAELSESDDFEVHFALSARDIELAEADDQDAGHVLSDEGSLIADQLSQARDRHVMWHAVAKLNFVVRRRYLPKVWKLSRQFLAFTAILVLLDATSCPDWPLVRAACVPFDVATPVLVALLGTGAATVLGLMHIVLRHHFPDGGDK